MLSETSAKEKWTWLVKHQLDGHFRSSRWMELMTWVEVVTGKVDSVVWVISCMAPGRVQQARIAGILAMVGDRSTVSTFSTAFGVVWRERKKQMRLLEEQSVEEA